MSYDMVNILQNHEISQELFDKIAQTEKLSQLVRLIFQLSLLFGKLFLEELLEQRSSEKTQWPNCPQCGKRLHSKGMFERQMTTLLGSVFWHRRIGRCPNKCQIGQVVPFDDALGIQAHQLSSTDLIELGCLLAVFVPYGIASQLLSHFLGISIDPMSLWNWVQCFGQKAMDQLESQLVAFQAGESVPPEMMEENLATLIALMGADGVFVPFRPNGGKPHGKTVFYEIKVGIITRIQEKITKAGKTVTSLLQRRLTAVLGDSEQLTQRLRLEAHLQRITEAEKVIWLSDGGKWLWNIVKNYFPWVVGILDFYHAAQNLSKAAKGYLDGRTQASKTWFQETRHRLRHGEEKELIKEIKQTIQEKKSDDKVDTTALESFITYIGNHENHIQYQTLKESGIPIGSGFVESACKWLIQQRFKCVGMRWSISGFNHLLHLRLLWVNGRWDTLFKPSPSP